MVTWPLRWALSSGGREPTTRPPWIRPSPAKTLMGSDDQNESMITRTRGGFRCVDTQRAVESISWREAIRDAVTDTYPQAPFTSPPLGTRFTVEVIFRMTPEDLARPAFDLDNFAKPVLDTLFTSQNVSRLTGVLLPGVNDTWVFRLLLEKVEVKTPQEQGADITVTWHPSVTPDLSTS